MAEMKLASMDWRTLNMRRGAIVEKLTQIFGA